MSSTDDRALLHGSDQPAAHEINKSEAQFAMFVCATNYTQNFASCLRSAGSARHSKD